MRLLELAQTPNITLHDLTDALSRTFDLERVGGDTRVYQVGNRLGAIYLVNNSTRGLGIIWPKGSRYVESICVWNKIDFDGSPDAMVDLPPEATLDAVLQPLVNFIKRPHTGIVEAVEDDDEIVLMARKPDGTLFEIPGVEEIARHIDKMLKANNRDQVGPTMEQQYELLDKKIELVAGGKSQFIKSLLITGMPSAGKTFRVMKKIKELGLQEGRDYIVKKGKITPRSLYRVMLEQINGMAIFDDCDSVVAYDDGVNMLKGALDTDAVREVSYDVKGMLNTGAMPKDKRDELQNVMSRILRGEASLADIAKLDPYRGVKTRQSTSVPDTGYDTSWMFDDDDSTPTQQEMSDAEEWVMNHLPNKIDFGGRIIFISNMSEDEWKEIGGGAILTRALHQNMYFSDAEMLDYIDTIKQHIRAPQLSENDKQEVLNYLRELWMAGKIKKPINFRLVQQAFDLFLMNDWRTLVADIG